jgi:hypothetical protein
VNKVNQQYDINLFMSDQDILLAYRDVITEETVQKLLDISEMKMTMNGEEKRLRKRVFNVLVECLQNVVNHSYQGEQDNASILLISRTPGAIIVHTGNMVDNTDISRFENRVAKVNELRASTVREAYNEQLSEAEFSAKGGAGLGLLDMYRRSGNPIDYAIRKIDAGKSFLSISVSIGRDQ